MSLVSVGDVERLLRDPSGAVRAETATKLARAYSNGGFTAAELDQAVLIFRLMVKDAEARVREALALHLKGNRSIPHDIAVTLARDIDAVALPMLAASEVLTAADLIDIILTQRSQAKMRAIAGRARVESDVVKALVGHGDEIVVSTVAGNPGAEFEDETYTLAIERFPASDSVQQRLIDRADLPPAVAERLVATVADHLKGRLLARTALTDAASAAIVLATRERATLSLARDFADAGVAALVAQLKQNQRLTGSIVLRAACMGHDRFFAHALASLCGMSVGQVGQHLRESKGVDALWRLAKLNERLLPAVQAAHAAMRAAGPGQDPGAAATRGVMRAYAEAGIGFAGDGLEDVLTVVNAYAARAPS
ncbi:MAG: DUF2336 domain-containing protein [Rhodospirillaceae bacterium]|nr:DUF2336 domain-containing protein [Rhodospirillaceae bacterium]